MKKKILSIALLICIALAALAGVIVYRNYEWFYTRFYLGNRMEGTYEVTVDGNRLEVSEVSYTLDGTDVKYKFDEETFSAKKGYYGIHNIGFNIENKKLYELTGDEYFNNEEKTTIIVDYFSTNCWHITKLDIKMNLIKENGEWTVDVTALDHDYPFTGKGYLWEGKAEYINGQHRIQFGP